MKLNLGSRDCAIEGFKNVDIEKHPGVDLVCDVSDLSRIATSGSVDEIIASHVLEHFSHKRTKEVLTEWGRVLRKGGILWLAVPDFSRVMEIYSRYGFSDWMRNYLWGDQEYPTAYHYTGFDFEYLSKILRDCGFSCDRVHRFPFVPAGMCCDNVFNFDGKSVSLNIKAVKLVGR